MVAKAPVWRSGPRRPVVSAAVDGLARTLGDGGILVPPDTPHAPAAAVSRVLDGEHPDPGPGGAYARQFRRAPRPRCTADTYRLLLAKRAGLRLRRQRATPATR